MSNILRSLEANKILNDAIPSLIEVFVNFYGEECREYITDKFNNMILVGYYDETTLNVLTINLQNEISEKLVREVFLKFGIEYTHDNVKKYTNNLSLNDSIILPIIVACNYINTVKLGKDEILREEQLVRYNRIKDYVPDLDFNDFICGKLTNEQIDKLPNYIKNNLEIWLQFDVEKILGNARNMSIEAFSDLYPLANTQNIDMLIESGKLDYLLEIGKEFEKAISKYDDYSKDHIDKYLAISERLSKLKETINKKYYDRYLLELKEYLVEEDQKELEKLVNEGEFYSWKLPSLEIILGNGLGGTKCIDYFDERSDEDLSNPHVKTYRKEIIKENRIRYFKYKGIDLGNNYDDYLNNPLVKKIWPSKEMIAQINNRSNYYQNEVNIEFYSQFDIYKEVKNRVLSKKLLDKEGILQSALFTRKQTCVITNIKEIGNKYKMYPVVCIYTSGDMYDDKALIHELNHVFELSLIDANKKEYTAVCGWDIIDSSMRQDGTQLSNTLNKSRDKRSYESFNEIINELLAQKMTEMMHEAGLYILSDSDNAKDRGGSLYDFSVFLVRTFFDEYFDDIVKSRRDNNIEIIWNKVGKDNFDELNNLFHEFNDNFSEFLYYHLMGDLSNNIDSDLVRKYKEIKNKRNIILDKMRKYSKKMG